MARMHTGWLVGVILTLAGCHGMDRSPFGTSPAPVPAPKNGAPRTPPPKFPTGDSFAPTPEAKSNPTAGAMSTPAIKTSAQAAAKQDDRVANNVTIKTPTAVPGNSGPAPKGEFIQVSAPQVMRPVPAPEMPGGPTGSVRPVESVESSFPKINGPFTNSAEQLPNAPRIASNMPSVTMPSPGMPVVTMPTVTTPVIMPAAGSGPAFPTTAPAPAPLPTTGLPQIAPPGPATLGPAGSPTTIYPPASR